MSLINLRLTFLRSRRVKIIGGVLVSIIILILVFCWFINLQNNKTKISIANTDTKTAIPSVSAQRLSYASLPLTVTSFAQVVSPISVILKAQTSGMISDIKFTPGQELKKGDVLFILQSNDTSAQLDQLAAQVEIAKQYYQRDQLLVKTGAIAEIDFLQAKSTYSQDLAQYQEALKIHTIVSPVTGIISDTGEAVGNFVNVGDVLGYIVDAHHMQIKYQLPSQYLTSTKLGQSVMFYPDHSSQVYNASVTYISPALSATDYSMTVRADFSNTQPVLNAFGKVVQVLDPKYQTLALPQGLVQTDVQGFYVYAVNKDSGDSHGDFIVTKQYFIPGNVTSSGLIEVQSGLSAGMEIISSDPSSFKVGQKVTLLTAASAS